jgi:SAM-dependent methyltransferase
MTNADGEHGKGLAWQVGVWDGMTAVYEEEIDRRFVPVVDQVMLRASLGPKHRVVDVGVGTGAVALRSARLVPEGEVIGVDISPRMLQITRRRAADARLTNVTVAEGRAEQLPLEDLSCDRILASLSLMYSLDRAAAASEFARVLRRGGRLVAAFWAGPERNDIVRFQELAGSFAPAPPVPGVGPGSMADGRRFVGALRDVGIDAKLETVMTGFVFDRFEDSWGPLAGVTAAQMDPARQDEAKIAVREAMWPEDGGPRYFANLTQLVTGEKL